MKLHLPKRLLAAMLLCISALATGTFAATTYNDVTYSGDIYNVATSASGTFHDRQFNNYYLGEGETWTESTSWAGNQKSFYHGTEQKSSNVDFWRYAFGDGAGKYSTLRLAGGTSNIYLDTQFSPFTLGGLIVESGDTSYTLGRKNGDCAFTIQAESGQSANFTIGADTNLSAGTTNSQNKDTFLVNSGGTWNVASGKTLTFAHFSDISTMTDAKMTIASDVAISITGGGTVALNVGNLTFGSGSSITIGEGSTLGLKSGEGWTVNETALSSGNGLGTATYTRDFGSSLANNGGKITLNGEEATLKDGVVSLAGKSTTYYVNDGQAGITTSELSAAQSVVVNNTTVAMDAGNISGSSKKQLINLKGSSSVLDATGSTVQGDAIKQMILAAQGEGLLKIKTGNQSWCSVGNNDILNANVDINGNGFEIDHGSFTISEGKTLTVHGKLQFEDNGTLTVNGTLDTSDTGAYIGLGHGNRQKGNMVISGLVKTNEIRNINAHQGNTVTLKDGGSLQVTGQNLIGGSYNDADAIYITVTDGKLIAEGNDWNLNHAVTIGKVEVQGANTVTLSETVTFNEGATVKVGSSEKTGNLTISGETSGKATFEISAGSMLVVTSDAVTVEMTALTLNAGSDITLGTNHNGTLTTSSLTAAGLATINADLVIAGEGATITFDNNAVITMGCAVTLGSSTNIQVTSDITEEQPYKLFDSVESLTLGSTQVQDGGTYDASAYNLMVNGVSAEDYVIQYTNGAVFLAVKGSDPLPEPTTGTLSLLALAGLMARRRRK